MNNELRRERWNLQAGAQKRQSDRVKERIYRDPNILIAAFAQAGGNWLKTAQILGIVYPTFWTGAEPPDQPLDIPTIIAQTKKLAEQVASPGIEGKLERVANVYRESYFMAQNHPDPERRAWFGRIVVEIMQLVSAGQAALDDEAQLLDPEP